MKENSVFKPRVASLCMIRSSKPRFGVFGERRVVTLRLGVVLFKLLLEPVLRENPGFAGERRDRRQRYMDRIPGGVDVDVLEHDPDEQRRSIAMTEGMEGEEETKQKKSNKHTNLYLCNRVHLIIFSPPYEGIGIATQGCIARCPKIKASPLL